MSNVDWASHFKNGCRTTSTRFSPRTNPQTVDFGSDVSDAILAYRSLWNDYVMGTIRAMDQMSADLVGVAESPPSGWTSDELTKLATDYATERDASLAAWNQFSGQGTSTQTAEGDVMLKAFQGIVTSTQKFWQDEKVKPLIPVSEPAKPSAADQKKVAAQIKASGVGTKSGFSLALQSLTGIELPTLPNAGDAIGGFIKDHWLVIGLTVVGVGLGVKVLGIAGKTYVKVLTGGLA